MAQPDPTHTESSDEAARRLTAGPLLVDLQDERLWKAGVPLRVGGKAFALLRALMESPQTLVTKDELFDRVWGGLAVSDSVLTTAVKELRQAIGDDARRPAVIETVHGRGYRFLLPVERAARLAEPSAPRPPRRWLRPAAGALLAVLALAAGLAWVSQVRPSWLGLPHPKSVAVAPFADLSPGRSEQWFADGLTEEVLSTLARTPDLRVAARGSLRAAAGGDLRRAARAARVAHVLTGSVRRSGDRLRVTADLIRASDGVHVWSQSYDRTSGDIIGIQEDISLQIAQALKTTTDPAKLRGMAAAGTASTAAYEAYLRGLALDRLQLEDGDLRYADQAAAAYEEARRLDPGFAAAHWRSAQTQFGNATRVDSPPPGDAATEAAQLAGFIERIDAAIAGSRDETETLKYRAARAAMQLRFRQAHQLMADYLKARPRDIDGWEEMADLAAYAGDRGDMARAGRRIHDLSVEALEPRSRAINVLTMSLRADEALARGREHLKLRPNSALALYQTHRAAIWAGRTGEARGYLHRLQASALPQDNKLLAQLRQACAEGRTGDAARLYPRLAASKRMTSRFHAAQIFGDEAAAVQALAPLDEPARLPTLMQFRIYPTFDTSAFPNLAARLAADGVTPTRAIPTPHGCRR